MGENIRFYTRRSIRLPGYDYSQVGYYFVTVVAHQRAHLFGEIVAGEMRVNMAGRMVKNMWYKIENDFSNVVLHDFIIMPNHMHGIIQIMNNNHFHHPVGADPVSALNLNDADDIFPPNSNNTDDVFSNSGTGLLLCDQRADTGSAPTAGDIPRIIQSFKRQTTNQYITHVKSGILPSFDKRIWQRNYYEHVIRNDADYDRLATYIANNPAKWSEDMFAKLQ